MQPESESMTIVVAQAARKESPLRKAYRQLMQPSNLVLLGLWAFFFFLVVCVQVGPCAE